jgi:hypothetical protein
MSNTFKLKCLTLIFGLILSCAGVIAQPTVLGTQTASGSYVTYDLQLRGGASFVRLQASTGAASGARNWEFARGTAASTDYTTNWRPYASGQTLSGFNAFIDPSSEASSARYNDRSGGQSALMPAITASNYYTFIVGTNGSSNNFMSVLETSYNPTVINAVAQSPLAANVYAGQVVTVTTTMAGALGSGEGVYLRYSTDAFSTSTVVAMTNSSGNDYTANIPNQLNGASIQYYVFTSNIASATVTANPTRADFYSLSIRTAGGFNIGGTNYTYTVNAWSTVSGATNWSTATSWNANAVPSTTNSLGTVTIGHNIALNQNATIVAAPISTGVTLTINSGSTLFSSGGVNSGNNTCNLTVNGTLQLNAGAFVGNNTTVTYGSTGSLIYNTGGPYNRSNEWPATNGPANVTVSNSGTNVNLGAARSLAGTLIVNTGCTFASSGNLTLTGNTSTPGNIGNSGGTISGNVNVEIAIPSGRRAYRLFGNPIDGTVALTAFTDDIHITGTGGASNGFDSTLNNSPSAFSFTEGSFNGTANSGWSAFTNTSQTIAARGTARIFYRGPRTQSNLLDGSNPTPNAATIDLTGVVNQGIENIAMGFTGANGGNAGWNLIPNPYPSNVNIGAISSGNRNSIASFSVWVPTNGTRGGYSTISFGSAYIIPTGGAFFVQTSSATNFVFNESDKTSSAVSASLLKTDPFKLNALQIDVTSNDTIFWDQFVFRNRDEASDSRDSLDGPKMENPDVNFYSVTSAAEKLAIDNRKVTAGQIVPLAFETSSDYNFTFKVSNLDFPGYNVYLKDNYTAQTMKLSDVFKYDFITNSDQSSKGKDRFSLLFELSATGLSTQVENQNSFYVYPNPVKNQINIAAKATQNGNFNYQIYNQLGQELVTGIFNGNATQTISVDELSQGIYFIRIYNSQGSETIKFIK